MANIVTDNKHYTDIANAIRGKNGASTKYKPSEMALAIKNIEFVGIPCTLTVETEAGAVITATLGNTTVSATANANGIATLILKKEGTWNITGTLNGSTKSTMVEVYHEIEEEIELANKFYINFLGNIYEYEFESGMTWNDFLLSDYNDNLGAHDVKLGYNVGPATITNALDFFGAPVLTEEFNKEKIDPNILIFPLNPDSANFSPVNGKTYIVHIDSLENVPWETVSAVSKAGKASQYWSVGDIKSLKRDGDTYSVQIVGFDHFEVDDPASYGRTYAGIAFQFVHVIGYKTDWATAKTMADSVVTNEIECKDLVPTIKYFYATNYNTTNIFTKTGKGINPTDTEISPAREYEKKDVGKCLAYYLAGNSREKDEWTSDNRGYSAGWWTRSYADRSGWYAFVDEAGGISRNRGDWAYAPVFCI